MYQYQNTYNVTCGFCSRTLWNNAYIISDQERRVVNAQYCFMKSSFTWNAGKVFKLQHLRPNCKQVTLCTVIHVNINVQTWTHCRLGKKSQWPNGTKTNFSKSV